MPDHLMASTVRRAFRIGVLRGIDWADEHPNGPNGEIDEEEMDRLLETWIAGEREREREVEDDEAPALAYEWWGPRSLVDTTPVKHITAEHPSKDGSLHYVSKGVRRVRLEAP